MRDDRDRERENFTQIGLIGATRLSQNKIE